MASTFHTITLEKAAEAYVLSRGKAHFLSIAQAIRAIRTLMPACKATDRPGGVTGGSIHCSRCARGVRLKNSRGRTTTAPFIGPEIARARADAYLIGRSPGDCPSSDRQHRQPDHFDIRG